MVLHQVKNWQNWKMQGCFMQFLHLIFVKKLQLQGALPPGPPLGTCCNPQVPTFQLTSILNSHAWYFVAGVETSWKLWGWLVYFWLIWAAYGSVWCYSDDCGGERCSHNRKLQPWTPNWCSGMCTRTHVQPCIHAPTHMLTHTGTHTHTRLHVHSYIHTCYMKPHTHTHTCSFTHSHMLHGAALCLSAGQLFSCIHLSIHPHALGSHL